MNTGRKNHEILIAVGKNFAFLAFAVAFFALLWVVVHAVAGNDYLVPSLGETLQAAGALLGSPSFWTAFFSTFLRALQAFTIALCLAVPLAIISGMVPVFQKFINLIVSILRSLPVLAILLLLLVWSTPAFAPVVVAVLALFPLLYTSLSAAIAGVDRELVEMCNVFHVPKMRRIRKMYLPAVAPYFLREGAGAIAFALKLVVSAEVMANTYKSLGGLMQESKIYTDMPRLFALTLLIVCLGALLEGGGILLARAVERRTR
jgi:NitT/TauT family transport system permease protein